jgi:hypothetical protein
VRHEPTARSKNAGLMIWFHCGTSGTAPWSEAAGASGGHWPSNCSSRLFDHLVGAVHAVSWYQDLLEDRLTRCGHSLDAVFRLTADRSNPLVALKRSTRIVDRLETARS